MTDFGDESLHFRTAIVLFNNLTSDGCLSSDDVFEIYYLSMRYYKRIYLSFQKN